MRNAWRNILRLSVVGLCFALAACSSKPTPRPGGATGSKAEEARREAEKLAIDSVNGGATAQAETLPQLAVNRTWKDRVLGKPVLPKDGKPPPPPVALEPVVKLPPGPKTAPRSGSLMHQRVVSTVPYATQAEAEEDVLELARELVEKRLAELDPPVRYKLSGNEVRTEFLRKDSRDVREPDAAEKETLAQYGVTGKLEYVAYDVEVTADQVRELRAQERVAGGLRILGMLVAAALAGFLFLRADEWTRGYLTSWLALGAVALAGGAAAALLFV